MIRHICAWQFHLLLCNHFLGLKSDIYLTMSCQKLSDNPSEFWPYRIFQSKYTKRIPPYLNFNFLDNDHLPLFFRQHFAFQFLPLYSFMVQFRKKGCCCCFDHLMVGTLSLVLPTSLHPFWLLPSWLVTCFDAFFSTTHIGFLWCWLWSKKMI